MTIYSERLSAKKVMKIMAIRKASDKMTRMSKAKAEGITEGIAKGKATIAKTLLLKGFDPESVAEITGLSAELIRAL
jgi:predicted transposase/invertase (TIGR01784 family)